LEVCFSAQAEQDLYEIWRYIAQDRPASADRIAEHIVERSNSLAQFPHQGRLRPEFGEGVRSIVIERWLVRVETESVFVGRIIDGARHLGRIRVPRA
jgi:toxin ParE1/3/4